MLTIELMITGLLSCGENSLYNRELCGNETDYLLNSTKYTNINYN